MILSWVTPFLTLRYNQKELRLTSSIRCKSIQGVKNLIFIITVGNMKRLPNKTFQNIDTVSGNCFILHVIAS
jgi:hypothetical protein